MHAPPLLHVAGATQSASEPHALLQTFVPHWYGAHELEVAGRQVPSPSQVRAAVNESVPVGQLAAWQPVPRTYFSQLPFPSHLPSVPHDDAP